MTGRIVLAAIVASIAMFIWMSIAHMSPLGMVGIQTLPDEAPVTGALKDTLADQRGIYVFPKAGMEGNGAPGPTGAVIYSPDDVPSMSGMMPMMASEFVLELVQVLILAFIIAYAKVDGFLCRVGVAAGVGAIAAMSTNGSYHIWYGYPLDYTVANAAIQFIAYVVAGLVLGKMLPKSEPAAP